MPRQFEIAGYVCCRLNCSILLEAYLAVRRMSYVGTYSACLRSLKFPFLPSKSATSTSSRLIERKCKGSRVKVHCWAYFALC